MLMLSRPMRWYAVALVSTLGGCAYPQFGFVGDREAASTDAIADGPAADVTLDTEPDAAVDGSIDVADGAGGADAEADVIADAPCPLPLAAIKAACASVPRLTVGQVVDGLPSEFCAVPATPFDASTAGGWTPTPLPAAASTERVLVRPAWTAMGLHLHVHVDDPNISVVPDGRTDLFEGDSLELFVSASAPTSGSYVTDHAMQIDVSPPTSSIPARAQIYASSMSKGPFDPSRWAARMVSGGWEVELFIPWTMLGGAAPAAGSTIGFDVAVNIDYDATKDGHLAWLAMERRDSPASTTCGGATGRPACDTRTFCATTLSP